MDFEPIEEIFGGVKHFDKDHTSGGTEQAQEDIVCEFGSMRR